MKKQTKHLPKRWKPTKNSISREANLGASIPSMWNVNTHKVILNLETYRQNYAYFRSVLHSKETGKKAIVPSSLLHSDEFNVPLVKAVVEVGLLAWFFFIIPYNGPAYHLILFFFLRALGMETNMLGEESGTTLKTSNPVATVFVSTGELSVVIARSCCLCLSPCNSDPTLLSLYVNLFIYLLRHLKRIEFHNRW